MIKHDEGYKVQPMSKKERQKRWWRKEFMRKIFAKGGGIP